MEMVPNLKSVKRIRFVLYSAGDLKIHEKVLKTKSRVSYCSGDHA
jgi:hypothetical protein